MAGQLQQQKTKMMFQKKKPGNTPPAFSISPFVIDSKHSRLNQIEILVFMSDYKQAYRLAHEFFVDFKKADKRLVLNISQKDTLRMISVLLYLQEKLKMYQAA